MRRILILFFICSLGAGFISHPDKAMAYDTSARAAMVVDMSSGAVLLEKNADAPLPPASMSKLMTLFMVFEALEQGRISLNDEFRISRRAHEMGGSRMFLQIDEVVRIEDLLRGVIIQSGNDAAVALAEAVAGTEEAFAEHMNERAQEIGLKDSHFVNATGWPDPGQLMSMRDLNHLGQIIIQRFPDYYHYFAESAFTWAGITQKNRNPLLTLGVGADGLKTGHTQEAGYGLVASAVRGNRRIMLVVSGLANEGDRRREAERLINWAFRAFQTKTLYKAGQTLITAPVWIGTERQVAMTPAKDLILTAPYGMLEKAKLTINYDGPIPAPIAKGDEIGHAQIDIPGLAPVKIPLVAADTVEKGGVIARLRAGFDLLVSRIKSSILG